MTRLMKALSDWLCVLTRLWGIVLLIHIHTISAQINTNATIFMDLGLGALSLSLERFYQWGPEVNEHLHLARNFTLEEARIGANFTLTVERHVLRKECNVGTCPHCGGTGKVTRKSASSEDPRDRWGRGSVRSTISLPCPRCLGGGMGSQLCSDTIYETRKEDVEVHLLPTQIRPGFRHTFHGKGHELFRNREVLLGNFFLIVQSVCTGAFCATSAGDVVLDVALRAWDALYGFQLASNISFLTGNVSSVMKIDRNGKTTLPGTEIVIPGKGLSPDRPLILAFALAAPVAAPPPVLNMKILFAEMMMEECGLGEKETLPTGAKANVDLKMNETIAQDEHVRSEHAKDSNARKILALLEMHKKQKDADSAEV